MSEIVFENGKPIVVNVMGGKGDAGLSAYQTWLSLGNTGTEQDFIDSLKAVRPYKVYTFLLSYTGSISVVVLENTLGDIVWTTEGADDIRGTLINAFSDEVKTRCMFLDVNQVIYARLEENVPFNFERFNNDSVNLYSTDIYLLSSMLLEIRVYD